MTCKTMEISPQVYARLAGVLYLAVIVLGAFSEGFVTNSLVVAGDFAATARNIMASPDLWNLGVACNLIVVICAVPQLWIEYLLLKPVSHKLMLLAVLLNLLSLAVECISKLFLLLVTHILNNADYLKVFEPGQVQMLAGLALKSHDIAFDIALIFFGFTCLVSGYLIYKSEFLPKLIGLLMQLAGLSYLVVCFSSFFAPAFAKAIMPAIFIPVLIGESSFCLWLLVKGVNVEKWRARASMG